MNGLLSTPSLPPSLCHRRRLFSSPRPSPPSSPLRRRWPFAEEQGRQLAAYCQFWPPAAQLDFHGRPLTAAHLCLPQVVVRRHCAAPDVLAPACRPAQYPPPSASHRRPPATLVMARVRRGLPSLSSHAQARQGPPPCSDIRSGLNCAARWDHSVSAVGFGALAPRTLSHSPPAPCGLHRSTATPTLAIERRPSTP